MNVWITALDGCATGAAADFTEQEKSRSTQKEVGHAPTSQASIFVCGQRRHKGRGFFLLLLVHPVCLLHQKKPRLGASSGTETQPSPNVAFT